MLKLSWLLTPSKLTDGAGIARLGAMNRAGRTLERAVGRVAAVAHGTQDALLPDLDELRGHRLVDAS